MTRPSRPQLFPPASRGCGALYARGPLSPRRLSRCRNRVVGEGQRLAKQRRGPQHYRTLTKGKQVSRSRGRTLAFLNTFLKMYSHVGTFSFYLMSKI